MTIRHLFTPYQKSEDIKGVGRSVNQNKRDNPIASKRTKDNQ
jgi:hypothetical protein